MSELKQTMQRAREFIAANLAECCRDELDWQKSSILRDGKLREAAAIFGEVDKTHAIPMAQSETARQAMQLACRTQPEATKPAQDLGAAILAMPCTVPEELMGNQAAVFGYKRGFNSAMSGASQLAIAFAALASPADALVAGDSAAMKTQLNQIGKSIGYGRAIQMLGQLWDDMLQAHYGIAARHQESMFRRDDIERIEAGLPIGRKVVYFQKRGRKEKITAWTPFDAEIPNVAHIISDTPLYGWPQANPNPDAAIQAQKDGHG